MALIAGRQIGMWLDNHCMMRRIAAEIIKEGLLEP